MTQRNIFMMNAGFFGVQFSFALTQTAINPLFTAMGADGHSLPLLNLAGPMTGLLIQPLIGAMSDRTWSDRWGRRRPYILAGSVVMIALCIVFPFISILWLGVLGLWLLDAGNNTSMEPYRALISDRLPKNQLARGFLIQSMLTGAGAVLANFSIFAFQKAAPGLAPNGIPYWAYVCFWLGAICIAITMFIAMRKRIELTPSEEEFAEMAEAKGGIGSFVKDIAGAVKVMPLAMHKIGLVFMFQFYAMFIYWQFVALSVGRSIFGVSDPEAQATLQNEAAGWSGLLNGSYNLVCAISALALLPLVQRYGGKFTHAAALVLGGLSMIWLSTANSQTTSILAMIGIGIMWASIVGVPYLMVASMVPPGRSGIYMGILNMMIVVPMLIETVTFGWIYQNLLDNDPTKAMFLAGALMLIGAVAMLWVTTPSDADESTIVPLGAPTGKLSTYERVIVGSDGTDHTLYGVHRAMEIAASANCRLTIVTAYLPEGTPDPDRGREEIYGEEAARHALKMTVNDLNHYRVRTYDSMLVPGDVSDALLQASADNPRRLIVVGNRGLGEHGEGVLGSVAAKVVKNAKSDVIIVQTDDLSDDVRLLRKG
ncbi:sugar transporter [Knoellia sinensis KCTC 19936]|uniref:Sugar transporter n=2 Tax=Knoellia TaxID=136099 RepID=A0A0A0JA12_9MICO|nr:sugar transporter [Knoellia sinensis KCTC 19936]